MHKVSRSILQTLVYSAIFNYPLTKAEICDRIIADQKISELALNTQLSKLHQDGLIRQTGSYFHLQKQAQTVNLRVKKTKISQLKKQHAKHISQQLIRLPYIKAVFLTGTVAVNNANEADDIDILIVTQANRLWSGRLLANLWLDFKGVRRHPNQKTATNKICPNMFLDENSLCISKSQRNLYTAHEVIQTYPIADPHHLHDQFLAQNRWILKYLPNLKLPDDSIRLTKQTNQFSATEVVIRQLQYWYMSRKKTREITTPQKAYFHPRDTAGIVLAEYEHKCRLYLKDS